jgi:hypothetical protein
VKVVPVVVVVLVLEIIGRARLQNVVKPPAYFVPIVCFVCT